MIQNFDYQTPTRLIFGKDVVKQLPDVLAPLGKKVLLTYGGGSIKRSGLYDTVKELLKDFEIVELSGIEPNPKYDPSVLEGVRLCKENNVDVILAVGGGSVLDCSKAIAAGALYDGDPWDLISYKVETTGALPIVDIMTMAATGSEYDAGGVISRTDTNEKIGYSSPYLFPVASLIDPTYTFTVPAYQTTAGVADAMNHLMEQYFCDDALPLNDGFMETALKVLMKEVKIVLAKPDDYEARAEIFQVCTYACNSILSLGNGQSGWPLHAMEHTLSAYYDITHGVGLAIITPRWMEHVLSERTLPRFAKFARDVMGITSSGDDMKDAKDGIQALYDFFVSINIPMHLKDVGIDETRLHEMAHHTAGDRLAHAWVPLNEEDIYTIYKNSL